jgi:hypothetical protein
MDLNRHPYEPEIEEPLHKALATSAEKAKAKKIISHLTGGGSFVAASVLDVEKIKRYKGFMKKWEPKL